MAFSMAALMFSIVTARQFATRQEEKENALAVSNERFTLTTKGANEGLFDWNLDTGEVFFSEQFRRMTSYNITSDADGMKEWIRLVLDADRKVVIEAMRRFRQNTKVNAINLEYRIAIKNKERRWIHTKVVAVRQGDAKRVTRFVGSINDITARKQNEVALRSSEIRFRSITEAHPVPVMIIGLRDGSIFYASPTAETLLGLTSEMMGGVRFSDLLPNREHRLAIFDDMFGGKEVNLREVRLVRGDGVTIDAALSARRISYEGQDAMVLGIYDLTERKAAEEQIARQHEALQQSEKMAALGGLLAGVAHELNNPLSVVIGQASLLLDSKPEPSIITRAEKIFKAADRCARIVKSFLALARRKPPQRTSMAVNDIIHSSLELLGYQIRTAGVEVEVELQEVLPNIIGDSDQMTQVITNLVLNAAQAMANWTGMRRIMVTTASTSPDKVTITVADTGPGVPPAIRKRVFEPFFTTKSHEGGTGVGLSLCLNIVASHGGQLLLEDAPEGGAAFIVELPVTQANETNMASVEGDECALPPLKILLVDDEVELAQTLADLLEVENHQIDIAANGAIALDKLRKNNFDLIISDLRMPVLDGPGLYEQLKLELPQYLKKIIYVTGDTLSSHVQNFLATYPLPVVEKPYRLKDIKIKIKDMILNNNGGE
jgi:PAS domain S-box-containing protein